MLELIGKVVESAAGRDKGRLCAVVAPCDEAHVYLADGRTHPLARPKKKKLRHLRFTGASIAMQPVLEGDPGAADAYLRKSLNALTKKESSKEG